MALQAEACGFARRCREALQFACAPIALGRAVLAGVQFDRVRTQLGRSSKLLDRRLDEHGDQHALRRQAARRRAASALPATASRPPSVVRSSRRSGTRQTACGRNFRAIASISAVAAISRLIGTLSPSTRARDVVVGDVAAVLAQVRGDPVGAGCDGDVRRADRIGVPAAAGVANGGDVVDVDAEAQRLGHFVGAPAISRERARRR